MFTWIICDEMIYLHSESLVEADQEQFQKLKNYLCRIYQITFDLNIRQVANLILLLYLVTVFGTLKNLFVIILLCFVCTCEFKRFE